MNDPLHKGPASSVPAKSIECHSSADDDPAKIVERREMLKELERALAVLDPAKREAVLSRYEPRIDGNHDPTTYVRRHRAMAVLRQHFRKRWPEEFARIPGRRRRDLKRSRRHLPRE